MESCTSNNNDGKVKTIFIKNQHGNKTPVQIKISHLNVTKFGEIFNAYAKMIGVERGDTRFLLDGEGCAWCSEAALAET